jgi:hypothetical protein
VEEAEADGTEAASTLFGGAPRDQSVGRELTVNRLTVLTETKYAGDDVGVGLIAGLAEPMSATEASEAKP